MIIGHPFFLPFERKQRKLQEFAFGTMPISGKKLFCELNCNISKALTVFGRTPNTVFLCLNPAKITTSTMPSTTRPTTNTGLIAFGSNQGDSMQIFQASIDAIQRIAGINVVAHSSPVWTAPVTGTLGSISTRSTEDQQPYLNAVIRICLLYTSPSPRDS